MSSDSLPDPTPPAAAGPTPFRAGKAVLVLLLVLGVQVVSGMGADLLWVAVHRKPGVQPQIPESNPFSFAVESVAALLVTLGLARRWARDIPGDPVPLGLGEGRPRGRALLAWGATGAVVAGIYVALVLVLTHGHWGLHMGPVASLAQRGGTSRALWAVVGILIAPLQEEVLFRGMLFKGFAASWGSPAASIGVTVLFVAGHFTETRYHWAGTLWIAALALAALAARLRTGSVRCSIAVHAAASIVIVTSTYAWF
jgi:membrane protease YdiL (CAAX protease family)